ncbi:hypothetical protein FHS78_000670 [Parvibaculum indicum]|uniref:hypothetical protein n=1 Tax=Parvibaculum indicum TaxID=562969 RepID=UPI00141FAA35|nr:hypothetical protein [Parvibaculum indicum]NIJ40400.1 hypothetical protein [Parvibaculum indicum]
MSERECRAEAARDRRAKSRPVDEQCVSMFMAMTIEQRKSFAAKVTKIIAPYKASLIFDEGSM